MTPDDEDETKDEGRTTNEGVQPSSFVQSDDPFDRIYLEWAKHALTKRANPPSRERWNLIVSRLILSEDPARVRRYKWLESTLPESLGADAYELWQKTPEYTPNLSIPLKSLPELEAYDLEQRGSMRRFMETQGLGERYDTLVRDYDQYLAERKTRIKRGQTQVMIMGCAGIGLILVMMASVFVVIFLQLTP